MSRPQKNPLRLLGITKDGCPLVVVQLRGAVQDALAE